ncbi:hypothetical protein BDN72DRAFT_846585 [Pluteus cervinus]|uniref:Uncharacterized protein n=1 Tax=Pluteus cervinus TaxID=181527 RepID=A0ACD3AFT2_9AGAR|nr:hypothetical protein BDN72DRAFT_846585 [Pluteus cervinus]
MPLIWARSDPEFRLTHGKLFETAYPRKYLPHVTDAQKQSMSQNDVYKITSNVFEHPSLDLDSIFQYSRLTGLVSIEDKVSIQLFLKECQDDIKLLDTKIRDNISTIARLSCDLAEASARMVQKVSQVRLCEYLLSSPQNLPQDILEEIFLACLAAGEDLYPGQTCPSLQLSAVCHRWRTIALSMPTLWNGLHLSSPTVHQIKSAESWASRCYLPTLTLEFDKANYSTRSSVRLREFLDTLRGPSRSLRKIDVIGLEGTLGEVIKEFLVEREQLALEELVHRDSSKGLPSLPKSLPNLRRIYAQTPPLDWHQFPPPSQLTVLWLTSKVQCTMLVNILVNCHDLESLYIRIGEDGLQYSLESLISKDITVPKLKYLGLWDEYRAEEPPVDLLRRITFPSLRVVEYSVSQRRQDSLLWLGFIHALHSVRRLTFQFHDLLPPIDTFAHLLGHASSISELLISTTAPCMPMAFFSTATQRFRICLDRDNSPVFRSSS